LAKSLIISFQREIQSVYSFHSNPVFCRLEFELNFLSLVKVRADVYILRETEMEF